MDFKLIFSSFILLLPLATLAQNLKEFSDKMNKDLPQKYDSITKLQTTSVQHNNLIFHFIVDANQSEFDLAMPKVRQQIMSTICSKPREKNLLTVQKAHLIYRYENAKGQSLGEFMVRPEHCLRN